MLELIQNPANKFAAMNRNPLRQTELKYGIPDDFYMIFDDLKQQISDGTLVQNAEKTAEK